VSTAAGEALSARRMTAAVSAVHLALNVVLAVVPTVSCRAWLLQRLRVFVDAAAQCAALGAQRRATPAAALRPAHAAAVLQCLLSHLHALYVQYSASPSSASWELGEALALARVQLRTATARDIAQAAAPQHVHEHNRIDDGGHLAAVQVVARVALRAEAGEGGGPCLSVMRRTLEETAEAASTLQALGAWSSSSLQLLSACQAFQAAGVTAGAGAAGQGGEDSDGWESDGEQEGGAQSPIGQQLPRSDDFEVAAHALCGGWVHLVGHLRWCALWLQQLQAPAALGAHPSAQATSACIQQVQHNMAQAVHALQGTFPPVAPPCASCRLPLLSVRRSAASRHPNQRRSEELPMAKCS